MNLRRKLNVYHENLFRFQKYIMDIENLIYSLNKSCHREIELSHICEQLSNETDMNRDILLEQILEHFCEKEGLLFVTKKGIVFPKCFLSWEQKRSY